MNQRILIILNAITAVGMATSVFTAQLKINLDLGFLSLAFPASNLFFSLTTFPVTDILSDVYGKKEATFTVWVGFMAQIMTVFIIQIALLFPGAELLEPFRSGSLYMFAGSTVAYFTAQMWDVWVFDFIKTKITGDKHLWIRNNLSTCTSQFINSAIIIAFVFGFEQLPALLLGSMIIKLMLAFIDTPFVYLGCYALRKLDTEKNDKEDTQLKN